MERKELVLEAAEEHTDELIEFLNAQLSQADCPRKARVQLDVAAEELFVNIARYAYDGEAGSVTVRTAFFDDPLCVQITFIDSGKPFDPLKTQAPDTSVSPEERPVGGLGIYLVKNSMDAIEYTYRDGCNVLTIRKEIQ